MTVESCLTACKDQGYPFAGVEFGSQCWCGVVLANDTQKVDTSQCAMPCNGNSKEICGGSAKINVYVANDLESLEPCGYVPPASSSSTTYPPHLDHLPADQHDDAPHDVPAHDDAAHQHQANHVQQPRLHDDGRHAAQVRVWLR